MLARLRGRITFANVVSVIALFGALGLGTAWALEANSVESRHIVNGQVKGADVAEGTLGKVPQAAVAQPRAFANVKPDGTVTRSRGVRQADVTVVGGETYCFRGLPFQPRGGQAAIDYSEANIDDDELHFDVGSGGGCPAGTQAFVWGPNGPLGFYIVFYG